MGAARSAGLDGNHIRASIRSGRSRLLLAAVSALALLGACVTGPSPEEIHQMDWQNAARLDTPPAYAQYMRVYPDGPYVSVARSRLDELGRIEEAAFDAARRTNTEAGYADFVQRFAWGTHFAEADGMRAKAAGPRLAAEERVDWANAQRTDVIDMYEFYLGKWPAGPNAAKAKDRLDALWRTDQGAYVRARRSGSPVELQEFVRAYPRSAYVADARREIDALRLKDGEAWRVALQANTVEAYDYYMSSQPWGEYRAAASDSIQDLRERDYQAWLYARQVDQIWAYENYRQMYPWGGWYNTAYYRIDWIRGGRDYDRWDRDWDNDNYRGRHRDDDNRRPPTGKQPPQQGGGSGPGSQPPPPPKPNAFDKAREMVTGKPSSSQPSQSSSEQSEPAKSSPPPSPPPPPPPPAAAPAEKPSVSERVRDLLGKKGE